MTYRRKNTVRSRRANPNQYGEGTLDAAVDGESDVSCHCHGPERLHRDKRTGRFVTSQLDHVDISRRSERNDSGINIPGINE